MGLERTSFNDHTDDWKPARPVSSSKTDLQTAGFPAQQYVVVVAVKKLQHVLSLLFVLLKRLVDIHNTFVQET